MNDTPINDNQPAKPFLPGNKLAKGGPRAGSGRKSYKEYKEIARAANGARHKLKKLWDQIESAYVHMATDRQHERTTIHAMENYVKPVSHAAESAPAIYNFIQFNNNPPQLPTEGLPAPILVSHGRRQEASGEGLAPEERQGQDGPQFHYFAHVPPKPSR